jgi:hypothetical protein
MQAPALQGFSQASVQLVPVQCTECTICVCQQCYSSCQQQLCRGSQTPRANITNEHARLPRAEPPQRLHGPAHNSYQHALVLHHSTRPSRAHVLHSVHSKHADACMQSSSVCHLHSPPAGHACNMASGTRRHLCLARLGGQGPHIRSCTLGMRLQGRRYHDVSASQQLETLACIHLDSPAGHITLDCHSRPI